VSVDNGCKVVELDDAAQLGVYMASEEREYSRYQSYGRSLPRLPPSRWVRRSLISARYPVLLALGDATTTCQSE
jgi:hypothetical protein